MIQLTIDGKSVEVPEGTTVLKASQLVGAKIPTLCDFPALKPYGGCRMCVVEIEGFRTLQASCTLPASKGMVIKTNTPKIQQARKFILSLIFSERNHFCMYCQKSGGDCELQNAAYAEEMTHWPIQPNWTPYPVDASHPYFVIDHNRCILCRRCVRACGELVGSFTLGIENRGYSSVLVADYGLPWGESSCVKCGTCVSVCPTGALIDRESSYQSLEKNVSHVQSTCIECSMGCSTDLLVRDNQLVRIDGDWDAEINGGVLCEAGRFKSRNNKPDRISSPMVRKNGKLEPVSWDEAFHVLTTHLSQSTGKNGHTVAAVASTRLPAEALYTFKDLFKDKLQSSQATSTDEDTTATIMQAQASTGFNFNGSLDDLKTSDCVIVVGEDLIDNSQVAGFFVKRNLPLGTQLITINTNPTKLAELANYPLTIKPGSEGVLLAGIMANLTSLGMDKAKPEQATDLSKYTPSMVSQETGISAEALLEVSRLIGDAQNPIFVVGNSSSPVLCAIADLARMSGAKAIITPKAQANSLAAYTYGLYGKFDPAGFQSVYLALGDDLPSEQMLQKLSNVPFLAVQAAYVSPATERADVILPVVTWMEQEGHYVNMEGKLQETHLAVQPDELVRTNVAVLENLAECLNFNPDGEWEETLTQQLRAATSVQR